MKRMSFDDYTAKAKKCSFQKGKGKEDYEGMSDEEYAEHMAEMDEGGEEDDDDSEKSLDASFPGEEELAKAMQTIVDVANDTPTAQRANRLAELAKSAADGGLDDAEADELRTLLEKAEGAGETLQKSLFDDEGVADALEFDASGLIKSLVDGVSDSVGMLGEEVSGIRASQERFNLNLAKGLDTLAKSVTGLLKSMDEKLEKSAKRIAELEALPLNWRGHQNIAKSDIQPSPRDALDPEMLAKSEGVTKKQAQRAVFDLMNKSMDEAEREQLLDVGLHLDSHTGDWRSCPQIASNPALVKRITETVG